MYTFELWISRRGCPFDLRRRIFSRVVLVHTGTYVESIIAASMRQLYRLHLSERSAPIVQSIRPSPFRSHGVLPLQSSPNGRLFKICANCVAPDRERESNTRDPISKRIYGSWPGNSHGQVAEHRNTFSTNCKILVNWFYNCIENQRSSRIIKYLEAIESSAFV